MFVLRWSGATSDCGVNRSLHSREVVINGVHYGDCGAAICSVDLRRRISMRRRD